MRFPPSLFFQFNRFLGILRLHLQGTTPKLKMDQRPIFNTVHSINQVTFVPDVNSIEASAHGHLQIEIPAEPGIYQANIQSKEPNEELNVLLGCLRLWRCPVSAPHRWHHSRRLPSFAIILCSAGKGSYADSNLKKCVGMNVFIDPFLGRFSGLFLEYIDKCLCCTKTDHLSNIFYEDIIFCHQFFCSVYAIEV